VSIGFIVLTGVVGVAGLALAIDLSRRLGRRVLTMRARAWVPSVSRLLSAWVNATDYSGDAFFTADGADAHIGRRRSEALDRLSAWFRTAHAKQADWGRSVREGFSDIRFADANRVPFPFARTMREKFDLTTVVTASEGPRLCNLDGAWSLDVSGSYGVNVAGFDRYKEWIEQGWNRVKALGPVLGPVHPIVADNIRMLRRNEDAGTSAIGPAHVLPHQRTETRRSAQDGGVGGKVGMKAPDERHLEAPSDEERGKSDRPRCRQVHQIDVIGLRPFEELSEPWEVDVHLRVERNRQTDGAQCEVVVGLGRQRCRGIDAQVDPGGRRLQGRAERRGDAVDFVEVVVGEDGNLHIRPPLEI
jgi:hypothetical protein